MARKYQPVLQLLLPPINYIAALMFIPILTRSTLTIFSQNARLIVTTMLSYLSQLGLEAVSVSTVNTFQKQFLFFIIQCQIKTKKHKYNKIRNNCNKNNIVFNMYLKDFLSECVLTFFLLYVLL